MNRRTFISGATLGMTSSPSLAAKAQAVPMPAKVIFDAGSSITLKPGDVLQVDVIAQNRYPGFKGEIYVPNELFTSDGYMAKAVALFDTITAPNPFVTNEQYEARAEWTKNKDKRRHELHFEDHPRTLRNQYGYSYLGANMLIQFWIRPPINQGHYYAIKAPDATGQMNTLVIRVE